MSDEIFEILARAKRAKLWNAQKYVAPREKGRLDDLPGFESDHRSNEADIATPTEKFSSKTSKILFTSSGMLVAIRSVEPTTGVEAINRYRRI